MSTVIFPSNSAWITARGENGQLTTENCKIILNQKIDSINRIIVSAKSVSISRIAYFDGFITHFKDDVPLSDLNYNGQRLDEIDITKQVVEYAKYATLSVKEKDSSWYYEHNDNSITCLL